MKNERKILTLWKYRKILLEISGNSAHFEKYLEISGSSTPFEKSSGNIGGNNPNPALNMFVKIKLFYTLPLYHWIHIKKKKIWNHWNAYLLTSRYHLKGIRNYFHSSSMVDSSTFLFGVCFWLLTFVNSLSWRLFLFWCILYQLLSWQTACDSTQKKPKINHRKVS